MVLNKKIILFSALMTVIFAAVAMALVTSSSPTTCSGAWTSCSNANANDANTATAAVTSSASKTGTWSAYGINIADSASITNVALRADFYASKSSGFASIRVSGDGGANYGPAHVIGGNTAEQTYNIDLTSDLAWTGSKLSSSNLVVEVTCYKDGSGPNPTCNLDWLQVSATYTPFDYSISLSPNSASVNQGASAQSTVTVGHVSGNPQAVALRVSGCPTDATCTLNQTTVTTGNTVTLDITAGANTPAGTYNINVSSNGTGTVFRSAIYSLTVIGFDYSLSTTPNNSTVNITQSAQTTVNVGHISGAAETVTLSIASCPSSLTCGLDQTSGTAPYTATLTVGTGTTGGTYNVNITSNGGGLTRSTIYKVTVVDSFPLASASASPSSGTAPLVVDFTGGVTGGNAPFTYLWTFGDGENSTDQSTQHTYASAGFYVYSFRVTDNDGDQAFRFGNVTVS
jgi:hypothetical protein